MPGKHVRVLMNFNSETDHRLAEIAGAVLAGMIGSKIYTDPPPELSLLPSTLNDFTTAIAGGRQGKGGVHATAWKNKVRRDLIVILRKLALHVQGHCNDDPAAVTSSGFQAASTVRVSGALSKPIILSVSNGHSGQLLVTVQIVPNAATYEVEFALITGDTIGPWKQAGSFTRSRKLPVNNLSPGENYAFRVRAVGGTTQYSDWSDPVSHRSL